MNKQKQPKSQRDETKTDFERFEFMTKNLLSVSNVEVRQKMAEEKRKKKTTKQKSS
jgi:hypothetical protein